MKTVFLNGGFVAEDAAKVSVSDRSFLYGDGLFETLRVYGGKPFRWEHHLMRLELGAIFLKIELPYTAGELRSFAAELLRKNQMPDAVLRIQLSRGSGIRGYAIAGAANPIITMTVHPLPNPVKREVQLITASVRVLANDPLAGLKTCNKLPQIVARTEAAEQGADDALMLNQRDEVAETTSCNLFWIESGTVCTPPLEAGILPGVTRGLILELSRHNNFAAEEKTANVDRLLRAEGVFLTSSVQEVIEVTTLDRNPLSRSPLVAKIEKAYRARIAEAR